MVQDGDRRQEQIQAYKSLWGFHYQCAVLWLHNISVAIHIEITSGDKN